MTLARAVVQHRRVEATAVVGDLQARAAPFGRQRDRNVLRPGVRRGVAQRLLRAAEQQRLGVRRQRERVVGLERGVHAAGAERPGEIAQRRHHAGAYSGCCNINVYVYKSLFF